MPNEEFNRRATDGTPNKDGPDSVTKLHELLVARGGNGSNEKARTKLKDTETELRIDGSRTHHVNGKGQACFNYKYRRRYSGPI